ncbi:hypothetical protein HDU96_001427 [Phlyctochytrium bullatum]|nr:hypothetical protein HDU96_001427 [Phlyctochytrium bullatum]
MSRSIFERQLQDAFEAAKDAGEAVKEARKAVQDAQTTVNRLAQLQLKLLSGSIPHSDQKLAEVRSSLKHGHAELTAAWAALKDREVALAKAWDAADEAQAELSEVGVEARSEKIPGFGSSSSMDTRNDAVFGKDLFDSLVAVGKFIQVSQLDTPGKPVLTKQQQRQLHKTQSSEASTDTMTTIIRQVLSESDHSLVYVKSENRPAQADNMHLRPDWEPEGFITLSGLYISATNRPYRALWDSLVLFEASLDLGDKHQPLAKVHRYIHKLSNGARAVLYDKTRCWLVSSKLKSIDRVEEIEWTTPGLRQHLLDFLVTGLRHSPWVPLIWSACSALNVELVPEDAFLGAGLTARVFRVRRHGDPTHGALKIVRLEYTSSLQMEKRRLESCEHTGLTVKVVPSSFVILDSGAAMLISPVGRPLDPHTFTLLDIRKMFNCLFALHEAGTVHRDARWPNIIEHEGRYLWIDLREEEVEADDGMRKKDVRMLANSILRRSMRDRSILEEVDWGEKDLSFEFYRRVADAVWRVY